MVYTAPGMNINRKSGLKYAISFDNAKPVLVDTFSEDYDANGSCVYWAQGVTENVHKTVSVHRIEKIGLRGLRVMMVDPGIVLKIVLDMGGVKPSYLGPPESYYKK